MQFSSWLRETAVRHRLEFAFARTVQACLRLMPMTAVRACGGALGAMVSVVDRFHRRIALENLARAFPSRSAGENAQVCPRDVHAFRHACCSS